MSPNKLTVLVVDDEKSLRDFVKRNLEVRGYQALTAANGLEALALFESNAVNLVILDLMMPYMNGLETIRRLRQTSQTPIIVLSALGEEEDKIQALNRGADDYLTKPFGVGELLARVQAVLRRAQVAKRPSTDALLVRGPLTADLDRHEIKLNQKPLDLTPTEFSLLVYFMENEGKVLPHQTILRHVWGPEYGQETEYLRVYIGRLRQKIEPDSARPRYLRTERGIGYSFITY
ncbi:MAG: response regulator transcription factor [Chloroflexi bacterium]|nr:response regulator transcription factor [Chloroflexota bacterium]MBK6711738.1 response regulator transcription factor [Chloroflexota bacterium]MBK7180136.1 response regulator transcription factor [Chloroflexota bacterium]MBK7920186.1 response regulator transcription factor [Chloroflexota bacterium]MBP7592012.1 response regulator transcription factor [Chloroflexota bacterium]